ncbi:hypothetical protein AVL50_13815 [Flammeovirga sp. SJP92]|nr:hypothetical protein AVL50_13815 [Flammeovirga sp. SJP92]
MGYMEHFSVKTFKQQLAMKKISLAFQGIFSQDVLALIGKSLRNTPESRVIAKRLFAIVIEMAQNIHHYSAEKQYSEKDGRDIGVGIVAIAEDDHHYIITSGNCIVKTEVPPLIERANYINGLSPEKLKEFYREQRKAPQREGKPGANLGFIDMVRKSGNPIEINIKEYDETRSFFILSVRVNKELQN